MVVIQFVEFKIDILWEGYVDFCVNFYFKICVYPFDFVPRCSLIICIRFEHTI